MPKLYHPKLRRFHEAGSEKSAALYKRSGWVDASEAPKAKQEKAGITAEPAEDSTNNK